MVPVEAIGSLKSRRVFCCRLAIDISAAVGRILFGRLSRTSARCVFAVPFGRGVSPRDKSFQCRLDSVVPFPFLTTGTTFKLRLSANAAGRDGMLDDLDKASLLHLFSFVQKSRQFGSTASRCLIICSSAAAFVPKSICQCMTVLELDRRQYRCLSFLSSGHLLCFGLAAIDRYVQVSMSWP